MFTSVLKDETVVIRVSSDRSLVDFVLKAEELENGVFFKKQKTKQEFALIFCFYVQG